MSGKAKNTIFLVLVLVVFTVGSWAVGGTSISPDFGDDALTFSGPQKFSFTVDYDQIADLELVELTDPGTMLSGGENRSYYWGSWENEAWGTYTLCAAKKIDTAILLTTRDGEYLVFNYQDGDTTQSMLQMFRDLLEHRTETEENT
ncbi:MAG: PH domain-containing protein [Oscillospiraceae bacterium]